MKPSRTITKLLQPYWRLTRGMTLGAQGVVIDDRDRVLLVRHGYRAGWFFPGGGVEWNETLRQALARELDEETGVRITGEPHLHGVFANFEKFPGDHVALFVVRHWDRPSVPQPGAEIAESGFYELSGLPANIDPATKRRLNELSQERDPAETW